MKKFIGFIVILAIVVCSILLSQRKDALQNAIDDAIAPALSASDFYGKYKGTFVSDLTGNKEIYTFIVSDTYMKVKSGTLSWKGKFKFDEDSESVYLKTKDKYDLTWYFAIEMDGSDYYATVEATTFKVKKIE